jgi:carboxymethylenebutenolidase
MSANARWIDIAVEGGSYKGYLSLPPAGKGPGIVLLEEIFGVNSHIRAVADQYAADGYVVLAPDLFWRHEPGLEFGYTDPDRSQAIEIMKKTDTAQTVADTASAAATLRGLPETTGKIAAIGYCFGGTISYLSAVGGAVDVAIAYYGGGVGTHIEKAAQVKIPIQFHFGELDHGIPMTVVDQVKKTFASRENAEVHVYPGADHGFNCTERGSYHPHSAALAHGRSLVFLGKHL